MNSLMMTSVEKIQGASWNFGIKDALKNEGVHASQNQLHERLGSDAYKEYMLKLSAAEPQVFPSEINKLPKAPTAKEVQENPSLAVYTYLHQESLQGSKSVACASCHIPRSSDGKLVHSIQSSREAKVKVDGKEYSGVSVETCASCHKDEKSIGTSYQGLIEKENSTAKEKKYIHLQGDIHFKKGMLCQDCHTSNDLHGDGFLSGASAAAVEVECQDCHGTTSSYPWELPLGHGDEFNTTTSTDARGTAVTVAEYLKQGSVEEPKEGYLLTARGNPLPHAIKDGNSIVIRLANGKDIELSPLKKLKEDKKLSQKALLSMDSISAHNEKMECYTCHATWAPQLYGNQLKIDYSDGKKGVDSLNKKSVDGEVNVEKGFLRWEEPPLSQNGEGRISPTIPSYLSRVTLIGADKNVLSHADTAGMSPLQPHTMQKESRSCESCHTTPKAMGMGIGGLKKDDNSTKLLSVESYFKLSAPLTKEHADKLDRSGVCISCHQDIPKGNLAISAMSHMAKMAEIDSENEMHNRIVNQAINITAWVEVAGGIFLSILILLGIYVTFFKKQPRNPRNEGWK
jgi:hypothetical protein